MTIDTLFFDLDGTLTDNYAGIAGCIVHALERFERPAPPDADLHACIGPPLRHNFSRLLETNDPDMIERAAKASAVRPEPHFRSRVVAGTDSGNPAANWAVRPRLLPWVPNWLATP